MGNHLQIYCLGISRNESGQVCTCKIRWLYKIHFAQTTDCTVCKYSRFLCSLTIRRMRKSIKWCRSSEYTLELPNCTKFQLKQKFRGNGQILRLGSKFRGPRKTLVPNNNSAESAKETLSSYWKDPVEQAFFFLVEVRRKCGFLYVIECRVSFLSTRFR